LAHRANIAIRTAAAKATAMAHASNVSIALHTLITGLSLVLLPGAVWTHAT
jgi:hypothetical protein